MIKDIFTVHTMRPDDVGAVEIVFTSEMEARAYARDRSTDFRVLASSVTRFTIGELGTRHPVAWFVDGKEQPQREPRPGGFYPTDGSPVLRSLHAAFPGPCSCVEGEAGPQAGRQVFPCRLRELAEDASSLKPGGLR
jgi:hypothetical protein